MLHQYCQAVDCPVLACSRRRHCSPTRDGHQPVMTGHNARRPRTGRERRSCWWPSEASYLSVWTLNDRFFAFLESTACFGGCSPNTGERKLKNRKFFGGVVGLDGRCSAQAEQRKKPVAVVHLPGAYLSTETNLVPIRCVMKKEFDDRTDRHTHTHTETHTHGIKIAPLWTCQRPRSLRRARDSLRTPAMHESQLLREKTTSSDLLSTCSETKFMPSFIDIAYTRNTRPCDVVKTCSRNTSDRSLA